MKTVIPYLLLFNLLISQTQLLPIKPVESPANNLNSISFLHYDNSDHLLIQKDLIQPLVRNLNSSIIQVEDMLLISNTVFTWNGSDWLGDSKMTYTYDANGNNLITYQEEWGGEDWENYLLSTITYYPDSVTNFYQQWNGQAWDNMRLYTSNLDINGNATRYIVQDWNGQAWVNLSRVLWTYDINGNHESYLSQFWEEQTWINNYYFTYIYNMDGYLLNSISHHSWNGIDWEEVEKRIWTHDESYNLINVLMQDLEDNIWVDNYQINYTYDSNGNRLTKFNQFWDGSVWVNTSSKETYTYDSNGNLLTHIYQEWNGEDWANYRLYTYTYDTNGNQLTFLEQEWDGTYWVGNSRRAYTYDSNGNLITFLIEHWNDSIWEGHRQWNYTYDTNGNELTFLEQEWNGATWQNYKRAEKSWEVLSVVNNHLIPESFIMHQNFPNPFNPFTTLQYNLPENSLVNITIYDMMGREVRTLVNQVEDAGYRSIIWDATNKYGKPVSAGIYLYQIQAGEYIQTKKMILLK